MNGTLDVSMLKAAEKGGSRVTVRINEKIEKKVIEIRELPIHRIIEGALSLKMTKVLRKKSGWFLLV